MSSNLNILPNKSWHVWKYDNRAKVEQDEILYKEKAEKDMKRKIVLDAQSRYERLKHRKSPKESYPLLTSLDDTQLQTSQKDPKRPKSGVSFNKKRNERKRLKKQNEKRRNLQQIAPRKRKSRFENIVDSFEDLKNSTVVVEKIKRKRKRKRKRKKSKRREDDDDDSVEIEKSIETQQPPQKKRKVDHPKKLPSIEELRKERLEREERERERKKRFLDSHL